MSEEKAFQKSNINCLSCIYGNYHLNPYKMEAFTTLQVLIKKEIKNEKIGQ